jgi:RNA polymerase sigma-70 factor (ECF subfamily)
VNEFGSNVERHRSELLVRCYRMLGSLPDAEDAVQETLLRAWRYRDSVKEGAPLRPWLYRVATNERLPRKYVCGVVPSIVRNISMKALTLS